MAAMAASRRVGTVLGSLGTFSRSGWSQVATRSTYSPVRKCVNLMVSRSLFQSQVPSLLPVNQEGMSLTKLHGALGLMTKKTNVLSTTTMRSFNTLCRRLPMGKEELFKTGGQFGNGRPALVQISRSVVLVSKRGKRKTCKAVAKRFFRTGKGKLKRWRCGKNHNLMNKRSKTRRQLRKHTYVSKTHLKLLNKMLNGW